MKQGNLQHEITSLHGKELQEDQRDAGKRILRLVQA